MISLSFTVYGTDPGLPPLSLRVHFPPFLNSTNSYLGVTFPALYQAGSVLYTACDFIAPMYFHLPITLSALVCACKAAKPQSKMAKRKILFMTAFFSLSKCLRKVDRSPLWCCRRPAIRERSPAHKKIPSGVAYSGGPCAQQRLIYQE